MFTQIVFADIFFFNFKYVEPLEQNYELKVRLV